MNLSKSKSQSNWADSFYLLKYNFVYANGFYGNVTGNLTGTATTATTSGFASTASYAYQSGYAITSGLATTSSNVNVVNSTANVNHSLLFTPSSDTISGAALSSNSTVSYNRSQLENKLRFLWMFIISDLYVVMKSYSNTPNYEVINFESKDYFGFIES